jgi:single-strand DNA-binding protein
MYQKIILVGNLGKDPESRYTPDGEHLITSFSVATSNYKKETTWWDVTTWNKTAEACQKYLEKGSRVLVEAEMKPNENGNPRIWQKKDGSPAASYEVTAQKVQFLSSLSEKTEEEEYPEYLKD